MKTLFIGLNEGRWSTTEAHAKFRGWHGVESWIYALGGDYRGGKVPPKEEVDRYDLVIGNTNPPLVPNLTQLASARRNEQKWVSLIEGAGEDYYTYPERIKPLLDVSDLVVTINSFTVPLFEALTASAVRNLGIPFPTRTFVPWRIPLERREQSVLVCQRRYRGMDMLVARELGLTVRAYAPKVSRTPRNLSLWLREGPAMTMREVRALEQRLAPVKCDVRLEVDQPEFNRQVAECLLWINMDPRYSWARFVLDAAALGIPIVTTECTGHGPILFPNTTVKDAFHVRDAIDIAKRLVHDRDFYIATVEYAQSKLEDYDEFVVAQRLLDELGLEGTPALH